MDWQSVAFTAIWVAASLVTLVVLVWVTWAFVVVRMFKKTSDKIDRQFNRRF